MSRNVADLGVLSRAAVTTTTAGGRDRAALPHGGERPAGREAVPRPAPRWKTRVLLPAALLSATAGLLAYAARDALVPATPVRVVPVVVRAVQGAGAPGGDAAGAAADGTGAVGGGAGSGSTVQAPGWVEPDPFAFAVSALTDGVVKEVLVVEGQAVEAGQVVLRMVDDDAKLALARAEADVATREGEIGVAKATLEAARRDWDHPVERTRAVDSAEAMLAEARAELERLPVEVEAERARADEMIDAAKRAESNVARRAVAESELVQTRLRLKAQEALVKSTEAKRPVLAAKVRQREAELTAAKDAATLRIAERKALDEATAALRQAEAAWRQSCAMCAEARLRLERMEVKAPSAGVVMVRLVEPGSKLMLASDDMRSAQAVRLYDPKKLQVRVDVPIADAAQVGVGQAAKVVVGVLPDRAFDGVVTRVVHEADIQRNTLQVKVAIRNPSPELKPEMLARVRFAPATRAEGVATGAGPAPASQQVFAPGRLLQRAGDSAQATAWVVDKGRGVATLRTVTLGRGGFDGWVAVASGLQPGDALVAGDTSGLREGTRVRVVGEEETGGAHGNH